MVVGIVVLIVQRNSNTVCTSVLLLSGFKAEERAENKWLGWLGPVLDFLIVHFGALTHSQSTCARTCSKSSIVTTV